MRIFVELCGVPHDCQMRCSARQGPHPPTFLGSRPQTFPFRKGAAACPLQQLVNNHASDIVDSPVGTFWAMLQVTPGAWTVRRSERSVGKKRSHPSSSTSSRLDTTRCRRGADHVPAARLQLRLDQLLRAEGRGLGRELQRDDY